jgi:hypothetical protein
MRIWRSMHPLARCPSVPRLEFRPASAQSSSSFESSHPFSVAYMKRPFASMNLEALVKTPSSRHPIVQRLRSDLPVVSLRRCRLRQWVCGYESLVPSRRVPLLLLGMYRSSGDVETEGRFRCRRTSEVGCEPRVRRCLSIPRRDFCHCNTTPVSWQSL